MKPFSKLQLTLIISAAILGLIILEIYAVRTNNVELVYIYVTTLFTAGMFYVNTIQVNLMNKTVKLSEEIFNYTKSEDNIRKILMDGELTVEQVSIQGRNTKIEVTNVGKSRLIIKKYRNSRQTEDGILESRGWRDIHLALMEGKKAETMVPLVHNFYDFKFVTHMQLLYETNSRYYLLEWSVVYDKANQNLVKIQPGSIATKPMPVGAVVD